MRLYVCYGTFRNAPRPGGHPCGNAHHSLKDAGYDPDVKRVYGLAFPPLNLTPGRREVKELTGQSLVPVLVTDDGEVIKDSKRIIAWAEANPAGAKAVG
jgi:Glutathione S-transferase, N-terminal domain